jgi:hypothetical protein
MRWKIYLPHKVGCSNLQSVQQNQMLDNTDHNRNSLHHSKNHSPARRSTKRSTGLNSNVSERLLDRNSRRPTSWSASKFNRNEQNEMKKWIYFVGLLMQIWIALLILLVKLRGQCVLLLESFALLVTTKLQH